ncbi:MAG: cytochrome ubiquinol oxidase subunit I [Chitinophagaceae bacterium]
MNVEILSRIQFAFTIAFHYIYPPMSIGLGLILVIMEGMYLKTGNKIYEQMTRFWIRIFALIFGIGTATGIIMEFTNASSSPQTMKILLIIALIGTPLVATYTGFLFWTFKGKVKLDEMSY